MSMRNIIYKRIDNVTKSELLNFFEFEHMSMSPYINYYTYKEYEKECKKLNIWYVDTSFNRTEILENTFHMLEKMIL